MNEPEEEGNARQSGQDPGQQHTSILLNRGPLAAAGGRGYTDLKIMLRPLLAAGLLVVAPAQARSGALIPDPALERLRAPFAAGEALAAAPPQENRLDSAQAQELAALTRRLRAVQDRRPPEGAAALEDFLIAYVDEIENAARELRLSEPLRARARRTYLSRLSRPNLPPGTARLLAGFMDPAQADAPTREKVQQLLARRAVTSGPKLAGLERAFATGRGVETTAAASAAAEVARRLPGKDAEMSLRRADFAPQQRMGKLADLPALTALPRAEVRPGLLLAAKTAFAAGLKKINDALPQNHALRVFDEAAQRLPAMAPGNTEQDAWRHARWHQRMVTDVCGGAGAMCKAPMTVAALATGTAHELMGAAHGQPFTEFAMDMNNNVQGLLAAWQGDDPTLIDGLLKKDRLVVLTPALKAPK